MRERRNARPARRMTSKVNYLLAMIRQLHVVSLRAHLESNRSRANAGRLREGSFAWKRRAPPSPASGTLVVIHDLQKRACSSKVPFRLCKAKSSKSSFPRREPHKLKLRGAVGHFFGCRFKDHISTAAVSAASFRSPGPAESENRAEVVRKAVGRARGSFLRN